jgi:hypothetical protein
MTSPSGELERVLKSEPILTGCAKIGIDLSQEPHFFRRGKRDCYAYIGSAEENKKSVLVVTQIGNHKPIFYVNCHLDPGVQLELFSEDPIVSYVRHVFHRRNRRNYEQFSSDMHLALQPFPDETYLELLE